MDSWSRCRAEGYGFTSVPYTAGCHDVQLDTWRPVRAGPAGEMRYVAGADHLITHDFGNFHREFEFFVCYASYQY